MSNGGPPTPEEPTRLTPLTQREAHLLLVSWGLRLLIHRRTRPRNQTLLDTVQADDQPDPAR